MISADHIIAHLIRVVGFAGGFAAGIMACAMAAAAGSVVPVPVVTVYPGDVIRNEMLRDRPFNPAAATKLAIHTDRAELIGKVARRTLLAGRPIPSNAVKVPDLVTQGRAVTVTYNAEGVIITGQAMPLEPGHAGSVISLRNLDSGRVIKGIVQADGSVLVGSE